MSDKIHVNDEGIGDRFIQLDIIQPIRLGWLPKEDITPYELAMALPFFNRVSPIMPSDFDKEAIYARHFKVYDPNIKKEE